MLAVVSTLCLVDCTKENKNITQDSNSKSVNINVSVDYPQISPETKTIIEQNPQGGLKVSWDANEEISLLSFDSNNKLLSIDNLASSGEKGRISTTFTGSYSNKKDAKGWIVLYPALTKSKYGNYIMRDKTSYDENKYWRTVFITGVSYNTTDYHTDSYQAANNHMSHLPQWDAMSAKIEKDPALGEIKGVTLQKHCAFLHLDLNVDLSHAGKKINSVIFDTYEAPLFICRTVGKANLGWLDGNKIISLIGIGDWAGREGILTLHLGKNYNGITVPSDGKLSVWIPFHVQHSSNPTIFKQGTPFQILLTDPDRRIIPSFAGAGFVMPRDLELHPGKIYTIKASIPKNKVKVASITPEKNNVTLKVGEKNSLKFTILPENAVDRRISKCEGYGDVVKINGFNFSNELTITGKKVGEVDLKVSNAITGVGTTVKIKVVAK